MLVFAGHWIRTALLLLSRDWIRTALLLLSRDWIRTALLNGKRELTLRRSGGGGDLRLSS
jgi:hypothetical protein